MSSNPINSPIDYFECPKCGAQFSIEWAGGLSQSMLRGYECPACKEVLASDTLIHLAHSSLDDLQTLFDDLSDIPASKRGELKPDKVLKTRARAIFVDEEKESSPSPSKQNPKAPEVQNKAEPLPVPTSSDEEKPVECTPLMEVAHPNLYRENGFRIAGLHVDATPKELSKHADKLKILDQIGYGKATNAAAFPLEPLPTLDQIREAMQHLKDPEKRLVSEFFWFWPETFGESSKDDALRALTQGDGARGYDIWTERKRDSAKSAVAYHNLAVLMHMLALDWTRSFIDSTPNEEAATRIKDYWKKANRYWKRTIDNDTIWDVIKSRIRALKDERLTTGFGRRMRKLLPESLGTINARLALRYAEQDKYDYATIHRDSVEGFGLSLKQQEKIFGTVLAPRRNRLLQMVKAIEVETNPRTKIELAASLVAEARSSAELFEFFYWLLPSQKTELFDQVALACTNAVLAYRSEAEVTESCVLLLNQSLSMAHQEDLRQRINTIVTNEETSLKRKTLDPFFLKLKQLREAIISPPAKLKQVTEEVIPAVMDWVEKEGTKSPLSDYLLDGVAWVLRSISVDAFNEVSDLNTTLEAYRLAAKLARGSEIKEQLKKDQTHLTTIGKRI